MKIKHAQITRTAVSITWEDPEKGDTSIDHNDAPLPSFKNALAALVPLVLTIMHLPETWAVGLRIVGVKIDDLGGADTVSIIARKDFDDLSKEMSLVTPPKLLMHPTEEGTYHPPLSEAHKAIVDELIEEAKSYVNGERAQGTLPLETPEEEAAEPQDGDALNFEAPPPAEEETAPEEAQSESLTLHREPGRVIPGTHPCLNSLSVKPSS